MPPRTETHTGDVTQMRRTRMKSFQNDLKNNEIFERNKNNFKKKIIRLKRKIHKQMAPNNTHYSRKKNSSDKNFNPPHTKPQNFNSAKQRYK